MRFSRLFIVTVWVWAWSLTVFAQEPAVRPNFTGVWKLDSHRSVLDRQAPDSATLYIHQNDPDFHLRLTEVQHGKSSAWSVHGRTDGKTLDFKNREGSKRSHMYWQGSQLVLEWQTRNKHGQTESQRVVRYSLSHDGKTLVASEEDDNHENKWVFNKSG